MKKYYKAYEERYKTIHDKGYSWTSDVPTPIVKDVFAKYLKNQGTILEIGCGEGRDAKLFFEQGNNYLGVDVSLNAIEYCQQKYPNHASSFKALDILSDDLNKKFDFIFAVAVLHMLVLDEDRKAFYKFIYNHLNKGGVALITSMGNGVTSMQSDINKAFDITKREHFSGEVEVATTSCRMVTFCTFKKEALENGFIITEEGITSCIPEFDKLMYLLIHKNSI